MQTDTQSLTELIRMLIEQHPVWASLLFSVFTLLVVGFVYLLIKERFSRHARDIADAGNAMADALKKNAETLATAPQIVQSFSGLVAGEVERATEAMEREMDEKVSASIAAEFDRRLEEMKLGLAEARRMVDEIGAIKNQVAAVAATAAENEKQLSDVLAEARQVIPSFELWKDVADPMELVARLNDTGTWDEGKEIVRRIQELVASSQDEPERVPAPYIEVVGDWCRRRNQFHLALWFYEQSVQRDPDRLSARVELHALRAEYVPAQREASLRELRQLALDQGSDLGAMGRIFDAYLSTRRSQELAGLYAELTVQERFKESPKAQAFFLRNLATAERSLASNQITPRAWEHISEAYRLDQSENVLMLYAAWMMERDEVDFDTAHALCERLLRMDPNDVSYYALLARLYARFHRMEEARRVLAAARGRVDSPEDLMRLRAAEGEIERVAREHDPQFLAHLVADAAAPAPEEAAPRPEEAVPGAVPAFLLAGHEAEKVEEGALAGVG